MKKSIIATLTAFLTIVGLAYCSTDITSVEDEVPVVTPVTTNITTIQTTSAVTTESVTTVTTTNVTTETITEVIIETEQEKPVETEASTEPIVESESQVKSVETESVETEEYLVYKPSTHYIHKNSCRWNSGDAYRVDCTTELVARLCDECNPDVGDYIEYVEPEPEIGYCSSEDREYLAQIVAHEAGSDWIGTYDKACVVAVVINRVNSSQYPDTVYSVLTQPYQFSGFWFGYSPSQSCYDAVDYYFSHQNEFSSSILYFYGNGYGNVFY